MLQSSCRLLLTSVSLNVCPSYRICVRPCPHSCLSSSLHVEGTPGFICSAPDLKAPFFHAADKLLRHQFLKQSMQGRQRAERILLLLVVLLLVTHASPCVATAVNVSPVNAG